MPSILNKCYITNLFRQQIRVLGIGRNNGLVTQIDGWRRSVNLSTPLLTTRRVTLCRLGIHAHQLKQLVGQKNSRSFGKWLTVLLTHNTTPAAGPEREQRTNEERRKSVSSTRPTDRHSMGPFSSFFASVKRCCFAVLMRRISSNAPAPRPRENSTHK